MTPTLKPGTWIKQPDAALGETESSETHNWLQNGSSSPLSNEQWAAERELPRIGGFIAPEYRGLFITQNGKLTKDRTLVTHGVRENPDPPPAIWFLRQEDPVTIAICSGTVNRILPSREQITRWLKSANPPYSYPELQAMQPFAVSEREIREAEQVLVLDLPEVYLESGVESDPGPEAGRMTRKEALVSIRRDTANMRTLAPRAHGLPEDRGWGETLRTFADSIELAVETLEANDIMDELRRGR